MMFEAPRFWWKKSSFLSCFLWPTSLLYGAVAKRNMNRQAPAIELPLLCVGNFTLGGTGKTPTVIALANAAKKKGLKAGIISRGFGANIKTTHIVDYHKDNAQDVGDEALLLSQHALVAIGSDRLASAHALQQLGCDIILMDDGFQSRHLVPDYSLLVVDGLRGLGNGKVFPSGPLRAPLHTQLAYTDEILVIGKNEYTKDNTNALAEQTQKPIEQGYLEPFSAQNFAPQTAFFAFAGIGNPKKFHYSIAQLGGVVKETQDFPDHYFFKNADLTKIAALCSERNLTPATTAKDYVRITSQGQTDILKNLIVFDVSVTFNDTNFCSKIIDKTILHFKNR